MQLSRNFSRSPWFFSTPLITFNVHLFFPQFLPPVLWVRHFTRNIREIWSQLSTSNCTITAKYRSHGVRGWGWGWRLLGERGKGWDVACARSLEGRWSLHSGERKVPLGAEPTNSKTSGKGVCRGRRLRQSLSDHWDRDACSGGRTGDRERWAVRSQGPACVSLGRYKEQFQWVGAETALRQKREKLRQMKTLSKDLATNE